MYTVVDADSGEFLCYSPETEMFFFSRSRTVIKEDYPTINAYLQIANEGYPEVTDGRNLQVMRVNLVTTGY